MLLLVKMIVIKQNVYVMTHVIVGLIISVRLYHAQARRFFLLTEHARIAPPTLPRLSKLIVPIFRAIAASTRLSTVTRTRVSVVTTASYSATIRAETVATRCSRASQAGRPTRRCVIAARTRTPHSRWKLSHVHAIRPCTCTRGGAVSAAPIQPATRARRTSRSAIATTTRPFSRVPRLSVSAHNSTG